MEGDIQTKGKRQFKFRAASSNGEQEFWLARIWVRELGIRLIGGFGKPA